MSEIPVVADCDRKFTLRAFFHLVVNRRPRMFITIREEGNRNRLRCEVLQKSVVEQRQVSIRQSIWIRIDRIRYMRLCSRPMRNVMRGMRIVDGKRELVVIMRRVLYRGAVLVYAGPVYADPFIANAWRYVGGPLS